LRVPPDAFTMMLDEPTAKVPRCVSMEVIVIVDPFAVREPPAPTLRVTALIARFEALVVTVVVPVLPAMLSVPPHFGALPAIVKVTVAAPELNVTLPANSCDWFANVMVCEEAELKVIAAARLHEADVEEFVHAPDAVQDPAAVEVRYAATLLTETLPDAETAEPLVRRIPVAPLTARPPPIVNP
jgi:hypothetical protein